MAEYSTKAARRRMEDCRWKDRCRGKLGRRLQYVDRRTGRLVLTLNSRLKTGLVATMMTTAVKIIAGENITSLISHSSASDRCNEAIRVGICEANLTGKCLARLNELGLSLDFDRYR